MAKRFRRFARRSSRPVARVHRAWDRTLFTDTAIDPSGATASFQLLASGAQTITTTATSGPAAQGATVLIKRIVYNGGVTIVPQVTTFGLDDFNIIWCLHASDVEDTDITLTSTAAGTILGGGVSKIFAAGSICGVAVESTGATANGVQVIPAMRLDLDLKCNYRLKYDENIYMAFQYQSNVQGTVLQSGASCLSAILMQW